MTRPVPLERFPDAELGDHGLAGAGRGGDHHRVAGEQCLDGLALERIERKRVVRFKLRDSVVESAEVADRSRIRNDRRIVRRSSAVTCWPMGSGCYSKEYGASQTGQTRPVVGAMLPAPATPDSLMRGAGERRTDDRRASCSRCRRVRTDRASCRVAAGGGASRERICHSGSATTPRSGSRRQASMSS